ncbi:MAG TPA: hypothetical protein VLF69_05035 [Candidatus Saccharimonadales bacterium]|nr:hypothetical protein [Candidatus Saccharimonadales bacterium]
MEARSIVRTILAALVGIGIVVLFIVVITKAFTHRGNGTANQVDITRSSNSLGEASILIDAPINLDQDHRQVKITVSAVQNEIDILQGYQGNVIDSRTYLNNSAAFATFLQALKLLNFAKGSTSTADYRGYCPTGDRYVYTFNDGQNDLFSYWSTSCGQGTFGGNRALVRELFERQIPSSDLDKLTGNIPLG